MFESATSYHNRFLSETRNHSERGTIKVFPLVDIHATLQTSVMPTNETRKGQLIFSGHQSRSTEGFDNAITSTVKIDKRIPVTSAFTEMILVDS